MLFLAPIVALVTKAATASAIAWFKAGVATAILVDKQKQKHKKHR